LEDEEELVYLERQELILIYSYLN